MTTDITNILIADRRLYRTKLAVFIEQVTTVPKVVLPYMPGVSKLQSPMISVTSGPTDRKRETSKSYLNFFGFGVRMIVLYNLASDENWTPQNAEDALDALEHETAIALLLADMQAEAQGWTSISTEGASTFDMVSDSGASWLTETIPVIMEVDDAQE